MKRKTRESTKLGMYLAITKGIWYHLEMQNLCLPPCPLEGLPIPNPFLVSMRATCKPSLGIIFQRRPGTKCSYNETKPWPPSPKTVSALHLEGKTPAKGRWSEREEKGRKDKKELCIRFTPPAWPEPCCRRVISWIYVQREEIDFTQDPGEREREPINSERAIRTRLG